MLFLTPQIGRGASCFYASGPRHVLATLVVTAALALGCDSGNHSKDASPTSSQQLAQVSVRLDLPTGGAPFLSMLAFRAEVTDVATPDVLGAVDPLVAPAPESACELRDVAGVARTVRAQGGVVNLQELSGVSLFVGEEQPPVHPAPKVYPPLADVVGGVIAEFGPLDLPQVPQSIGLVVPGQSSDAPITWAPPAALAVADSGDVPLGAETQLTMKGDLVLRVLGPLRTFLEVRPFGAPSAITCAVTSGGWVVVPHDLLVKLEASAGRAPISFEAVWRENRLVLAGSEVMRVSFEARSSAVLELRP